VLWQQVSHLLLKYTKSGYGTVLMAACARQGCSATDYEINIYSNVTASSDMLFASSLVKINSLIQNIHSTRWTEYSVYKTEQCDIINPSSLVK
jgi:hypothetical protein